MVKLIFLIAIYGVYNLPVFASMQTLNKEESKIVNDLNSQGFKLDKTNLVVLNGYATKSNLPEGSRYRLTFSCQHNYKIDTCKVSGLAIKPEKQ